MARQPRMHAPGDIHHVMSHSIDSVELFSSPADRYFFLEILDKYFRLFDCHCYGFAIMTNHYHLIVRPSGDKDHFSRMMQCINGTLAEYVNNKLGRRGSVYWDRFKSIPTREADYVGRLILYVHANPLKSGVVSDIGGLADYRWTSHALLFEKNIAHRYPWLKTDYMRERLGISGTSCSSYLAKLAQYETSTFDPWHYDEQRGKAVPLMPKHMSSDEHKWVTAIVEKAEKERAFRIQLQKQPDLLRTLQKWVCDRFGLQKIYKKKLGGEERIAFQIFSYWTIVVTGYPGTLIARILGCHPSTALRAARIGRSFAPDFPFPLTPPGSPPQVD